MTERTPWPRLLAFAQQLGLTPAEFWRLSFREWRAIAAGRGAALTRGAFETLMRRFPD